VAGTAAVEAAVRAINGQLRPNSSVAPVALQKHLQRRHRDQARDWARRLRQKRAQQFIHPKRRQRRAGNMRLHHL
jgi:hypothetical protein